DPYAGAGDTPGAFYASYYDANTLANLPTEQPQVLIIDRPSAFSSVDATAIMRYIETGGAVIYFLSDAIDKANLQFLQSASAGQLLMPFTIADVQTYGDNAADAGFASIGAVNFDEPMLRKFRDSGDLANIQIYRHFATESAGGGAASLMRFSDGNVAMARASFGTGMILLCNFSPGLDFS